MRNSSSSSDCGLRVSFTTYNLAQKLSDNSSFKGLKAAKIFSRASPSAKEGLMMHIIVGTT